MRMRRQTRSMSRAGVDADDLTLPARRPKRRKISKNKKEEEDPEDGGGSPAPSEPDPGPATNNTNPFDGLPRELRDKIWKYTVVDERTTEPRLSYTDVNNQIITGSWRGTVTLPMERGHLAITRTNRRISEEVFQTYYEHNNFSFTNISRLGEFLDGMSPLHRSWVRHIRLNWRYISTSRAFDLLRYCVNLRRLDLLLENASIRPRDQGLVPMDVEGIVQLPQLRQLRVRSPTNLNLTISWFPTLLFPNSFVAGDVTALSQSVSSLVKSAPITNEDLQRRHKIGQTAWEKRLRKGNWKRIAIQQPVPSPAPSSKSPSLQEDDDDDSNGGDEIDGDNGGDGNDENNDDDHYDEYTFYQDEEDNNPDADNGDAGEDNQDAEDLEESGEELMAVE